MLMNRWFALAALSFLSLNLVAMEKDNASEADHSSVNENLCKQLNSSDGDNVLEYYLANGYALWYLSQCENALKKHGQWLALGKCRNLLEIGCWKKATEEVIAPHVIQGQIVATSWNKSMIDAVSGGQKRENITYEVLNVDTVEIWAKYKNKFDCVIALDALNFVSDYENFFKNLLGAVVPGGKILLGGEIKVWKLGERKEDYVWQAVKSVAKKDKCKKTFDKMGGCEKFLKDNERAHIGTIEGYLKNAGFKEINHEPKNGDYCFANPDGLQQFLYRFLKFDKDISDDEKKKLVEAVAEKYKIITEGRRWISPNGVFDIWAVKKALPRRRTYIIT